MQKGKLGISLGFYAVLAFVLAGLNQLLLGALLLGLVLVVEKDVWTGKMCMQAFFIGIVNMLINNILNEIRLVPFIGNFLVVPFQIILGIVSILLLVCIIIGIVKAAKGQDLTLPVFGNLANRAFGYVTKKVYTNVPPANVAYTQVPPQQPVAPGPQNQPPQAQ